MTALEPEEEANDDTSDEAAIDVPSINDFYKQIVPFETAMF